MNILSRLRQRLIGFTIPMVMAAILFPIAGRIDLPFFWIAVLAPTPLSFFIGPRVDPELLHERLRPAAGGIDRHLRTLGTPFFLGQLVVAALDVGRYHWSPAMHPALQFAGAAGFVGGLGFAAWAMLVNRFFSPVVRIQSERGHHLIATGPYAIIRHPGYCGTLLAWPSLSFALGSWWSLAALSPLVLLVFRRVVLEDRFLFESLEGYREYAARVRFRLIPGIW
ncbi:MAG: isoprenylcysteine carboxylmethyltransferase family protein [Phycisphaerae bacterium]|nr:isoprenylcysteine carboxylmethyltransferase family protein [Phycisphaerae bacterium]